MDETNKTYKVYVHINKINGKQYFGITSTSTSQRWANYNKNSPIRRAFNKYGRENFQSEVILDGLTKEEAESFEIYFIARYHSLVGEWGYNIEHGGSASGKCSEQQKQHSSEVFTDYYSDPAHREENSKRMKEYWEKHYAYMRETSQSKESRMKRSNSLKETFAKQEVKENLSERLKERWADPEYKQKMSDYMKENAWNNVSVVCNGIEYNSISDFCRKNNLLRDTVRNWLEGSDSMPVEWYDKGLRYKNKENKARPRTNKGKFCLEIDGKTFTKLIDMANYIGIPYKTLGRYVKGQRKCPQYLLDRGFKVIE